MNNSRVARGFTIIEVLIVLAIAGLILLIIFLAIPAMQRQTRNTQRKHDIGLIAAAVSNYKTNNANQLPNCLQTDPGDSESIDIAKLPVTNIETVKLGYYDGSGSPAPCTTKAGMIFIDATSPIAPPAYAPNVVSSSAPGARNKNKIDTESVSIVPGEDCNAAGTSFGNINSNAVAIFYVLESGSGVGNLVCLNA